MHHYTILQLPLHHAQQIYTPNITKSRLWSGFYVHTYHARVAAFEMVRLRVGDMQPQ